MLLTRKRQPADYAFSTANYDQFQLIYVQKGVLRMQVYKRDMDLHPGSLALLRKSSSFRLSSEKGYSGLGVIIVDSETPELSGEARGLRSDIQMSTTAQLIDHYLLMPDAESKRVLRAMSLALVWQTLGLEKRQLAQHAQKWPEIARAVLDVNLGTGLSAREALSHIPLCYRQLSRLFTARFGMSPKQYQVAARINEAKRMLANSDFSITDTAMELGFASSQHFATQFKNVTGTTPRAFLAADHAPPLPSVTP